MTKTGADFIQLARLAVAAIAADDELVDVLVLKGGTALQLIHKVGARASKDVDFSMADDRMAESELCARLKHSLESRFDAEGYEAFDYRFERRPQRKQDPTSRWGGYNAWIRVVKRDALAAKALELRKQNRAQTKSRMANVRMGLSVEVKLELSRWEHVEGSVMHQLDDGLGLSVRVYTPAMIAAEKLRALCQQMEGQRNKPTSRARDFYDIHALVTGRERVELGQQGELVRAMFAAKSVPLELLGKLGLDSERERHRTSWDQVRNAVSGEELLGYDEYFDFVVKEVKKLEALWVVDAPV